MSSTAKPQSNKTSLKKLRSIEFAKTEDPQKKPFSLSLVSASNSNRNIPVSESNQ